MLREGMGARGTKAKPSVSRIPAALLYAPLSHEPAARSDFANARPELILGRCAGALYVARTEMDQSCAETGNCVLMRPAARFGGCDSASSAELSEDYRATAIEQSLADGLALSDLKRISFFPTMRHFLRRLEIYLDPQSNAECADQIRQMVGRSPQ
jgi:hypothetical protein